MFHDVYLVQDARTPFGTLQSPLRYAGVLMAGMSIPPVASYDPVKAIGYINNQPVSRLQFTSMLTSLKEQAEALHRELLLGYKSQLAERWQRPDRLEESVGTHSNGYGYLVKNPFFTQFHSALARHIVDEDALCARFVLPFAPGGEIQWNHPALFQWMSNADQFCLYLACLFYFLAGQPPRMPELLSMRIYKGSKGQRNLYLMENELVWFLKYTKSESMTGQPLPVIRVLPRFVRDLVEQYLALVRPLQIAFCALLGHPVGDHAQFLFLHRGKVMSSDIFATGLRALSMRHVSQRWGVRAWRQYIIVLSHNVLPKAVLEAPLVLTAVVAQASHRATAGQQHYNQQVGTTFATVNSNQFRQFFTASLALQEALGFPHPELSHAISESHLGIQIDHKAIASMITAEVVKQVLPQFTHGLLGSIVGPTVTQALSQPESAHFVPLDGLVEPPTLQLLRKLYRDPSVCFRSPAQAQAVQYVLDRRPDPLLVVHPLGSGKMAIVHLAALAAPDRMTLMLVPLVSLGQSAEVNAKRMGIDAVFIQMDNTDIFQMRTVPMLILTHDRFVYNTSIQKWIQSKAHAGILQRVVVDEAHCLVNRPDYRPVFSRVYREIIKVAQVPIVFMTGTLPPRLLPAFRSLLYLHPGQPVYVSRQPSHVANLAYAIANRRAQAAQISRFCDELSESIVPGLREDIQARVLIFATSRDYVQGIAERLGCPLYHGELPEEVKEANLAKWMDIKSTQVENVSIGELLSHMTDKKRAAYYGCNYSPGNGYSLPPRSSCLLVRGHVFHYRFRSDGGEGRMGWKEGRGRSLSSREPLQGCGRGLDRIQDDGGLQAGRVVTLGGWTGALLLRPDQCRPV